MNPHDLGKLAPAGADRDAVHVAVAPVVAGQDLAPGWRVAIRDGRAWWAAEITEAHGTVDPFLPKPVKAGQRFWLLMLPGQVKGLRHEWHHPALVLQSTAAPPPEDEETDEEHEEWCKGAGCSEDDR